MTEVGAPLPNLTPSYVFSVFNLVFGILNLFFGYKINSSEDKEKFFTWGIIVLISTFFLSGLLTGISSLVTISPLYNMTSQY